MKFPETVSMIFCNEYLFIEILCGIIFYLGVINNRIYKSEYNIMRTH